MRIANGTDIVEIDRIKEDIDKYGFKFLNRIFTENEINYCESKKSQKYQSYAVRFAAKEAIYKALSDSINTTYSWKDFEIINTPKGKPIVNLGITIENIEDISVSLSHCREYCIANVVVIYK